VQLAAGRDYSVQHELHGGLLQTYLMHACMPMGTLLLYLLLHTMLCGAVCYLCFESQSQILTHNSALIHFQPKLRR